MLTNLGAGRCAGPLLDDQSICRTQLSTYGRRTRRSCDLHAPTTEDQERCARADREAISSLLIAVGEALSL